MADFLKAFRETIGIGEQKGDEGGYNLHRVKGDSGGDTFAGIAKNYHPDWPGWALVYAGKGDTPEGRRLVIDFYKETFWADMLGDKIIHQEVAETIFNFGMNSSIENSVRYAQFCLDCVPDGDLGPITLKAINDLKGLEVELFVCQHVLMRIGHRLKRINQNRSQKKFISGWIKRDLRMLDDYININQYFGIR